MTIPSVSQFEIPHYNVESTLKPSREVFYHCKMEVMDKNEKVSEFPGFNWKKIL